MVELFDYVFNQLEKAMMDGYAHVQLLSYILVLGLVDTDTDTEIPLMLLCIVNLVC